MQINAIIARGEVEHDYSKLHETKPNLITGVIALHLQLDSRIMPRDKYVGNTCAMLESILIIMKKYMKLEQAYRDSEVINNLN